MALRPSIQCNRCMVRSDPRTRLSTDHRTFGVGDVHDTGEIHVTRRFVPHLPIGVPLFGSLQTKISGQWYATDTFTVGANTVSATVQIDSALWATDFVRSMAPSDNRPFGWTALARQIASQSQYNAFCTDYAATLLHVLDEMNIQTAARTSRPVVQCHAVKCAHARRASESRYRGWLCSIRPSACQPNGPTVHGRARRMSRGPRSHLIGRRSPTCSSAQPEIPTHAATTWTTLLYVNVYTKANRL